MPNKELTTDDDGRCAYCRVKDFVATLRDDLEIPADVVAFALETQARLVRQAMREPAA